MATTRFGHLDDFTLKNSKVGIGTSDPTEALEVIGGSRSQDIKVAGIATLTSYSGFQNKKTSYVENISINSGESGTLSGEIVIGAGLTMSVGTGATTGQGSIKSLKVSNTFTPPIGGTNERPSAPQPGALYYNKDFRMIEYWDGSFWRQVDNTTRRGRGIYAGGAEPGIGHETMQFFEASTLGNTHNFGELSFAHYSTTGGFGNEIRGVMAGSGPETNTMEYITIASAGNGIDFGDMTEGRGYSGGTASSTRGIIAGGYDHPTNVNTIDYVEIMTTGNAKDFGDLTAIATDPGACNNPVRSIFSGRGGATAAIMEVIDVVTTATKGNAVRFGDMVSASDSCTAHSNSTRGIIGTSKATVGAYGLELASEGNSYAFADLTINVREQCYNTGNMTRSVIGGGYTPGYTNSMEYVTISTAGSAADFGDMMRAITAGSSFSDSHGGLGGF